MSVPFLVSCVLGVWVNAVESKGFKNTAHRHDEWYRGQIMKKQTISRYNYYELEHQLSSFENDTPPNYPTLIITQIDYATHVLESEVGVIMAIR